MALPEMPADAGQNGGTSFSLCKSRTEHLATKDKTIESECNQHGGSDTGEKGRVLPSKGVSSTMQQGGTKWRVLPSYGVSPTNNYGGTDADVKTRIRKDRGAFITLRNIWKSRQIRTHTKVRLFNSNVKSVLVYGAETWRTTKATTQKIQTFINFCLRRILQIRWHDTISNIDLWKETNQLYP